MIEAALCFTFLTPMFLGVVAIGINLIRSIVTMQVCRDAGSMFVRSVDFSKTGNQDMLVKLAQGMNMTRTGGDGVIILSKLMKIGALQCADGSGTLADCTNNGQTVIVQRLYIGNQSLRTSSMGTPPSSLAGTDGSYDPEVYLKNTALAVSGFNTLLPLGDGETAYVSETYFAPPLSSIPGYGSTAGSYARTIF